MHEHSPSPTISQQIDREKVEAVTDFIFLGSQITVDVDCSPEFQTLPPWKKSYDRPRQHIKKRRHHFANKSPYVKAMIFVVVMYTCESWTIK